MNTSDSLRIAGQLLFLMRSQWWPEERIRAYQEEKLLAILKHAVSRVPYYRSLGIRPESIKSGVDLWRFPILSKHEIQEHEDDLLCSSMEKGELYVSRTSGTTCEPTRTYFDLDSWLMGKYALKARRMISTTRLFMKKLLVISEQPVEKMHEVEGSVPPGVHLLFKQRYLSLFDDPSHHIPTLLDYRPDILYSFPSYLLELSHEMNRRNIQCPRIPVIFTSSELLTPQSREKIQKQFQAEVYDIYGSTEFKEVAWQCREGLYHVNFEHVFLEGEGGGNGKSNGAVNLLITTLTNRGMPLIRFDTGDIGRVGWKQCRCGRSSPSVDSLSGREVDQIRLPGGRRISPYLLTMKIEAFPGIRKFQIVQDSSLSLRIDYIVYEHAIRIDIEKRLKAEIEKLFEENIRISFKRVNEIRASDSGKYQIVSKE